VERLTVGLLRLRDSDREADVQKYVATGPTMAQLNVLPKKDFLVDLTRIVDNKTLNFPVRKRAFYELILGSGWNLERAQNHGTGRFSHDEMVQMAAEILQWKTSSNQRLRDALPEMLNVTPPEDRAIARQPLLQMRQRLLRQTLSELSDPQPSVRRQAARMISRISPRDKEALSALVVSLTDGDSRVREAVATAIGEIKHGEGNTLKEGLQSNQRKQVLTTIDQIIDAKTHDLAAIHALTEALKSEDANLIYAASAAIEVIKRAEHRLSHELRLFAKARDRNLRDKAERALGSFRLQDPVVTGGLMAALSRPTRRRERVARALGALQDDSPLILSFLLDALASPDEDLRVGAAEAFAEIKPRDPRIARALAERLTDSKWLVRANVAQALGDLRSLDPFVIRALTAALQDKEKAVLGWVITALKDIKPKDLQVARALAERLADTEGQVRWNAAQALAEIGLRQMKDEGIALALVEALRDDDWWIRFNAAKALTSMSPDFPAVFAKLKTIKNDEARSTLRSLWPNRLKTWVTGERKSSAPGANAADSVPR
jgi:HEAT repeat protein